MPQVKPKVVMLRYTSDPENIVAMGAKLCYSATDVEGLMGKIESKDQSAFIKKLADLGHMSPVEHASFTFGIEGVSRSFLAQITRHRIASFSVQSQRYVTQAKEGTDFNYIIPPAIEALGEEAIEKYKNQMAVIDGFYKDWVQELGNKGESSNEDARFVLPNGCETKMIVTMNARELMHFFEIRCCNRAQWEIRAVAWEMLRLCLDVAPNLFASAGPSCLFGACSEGSMTCGKMTEVREKYKRMREI